jgi:DNA-binding response OmpR family regulator
LLEAYLSETDYDIQTATDGEETLRMVGEWQPDLILLDIMMPGVDGYEVAGKIKGNLATRNIPVIMVTAMVDRNTRLLGLSAGADDFLTKPIDRAELCVRVKNLLRLKAYGEYVERLEEVAQRDRGFLSTVSQELRTPLTSIRESLGLLASGAVGALSDEAVEVVAIAERNAVRLIALINDIP